MLLMLPCVDVTFDTLMLGISVVGVHPRSGIHACSEAAEHLFMPQAETLRIERRQSIVAAALRAAGDVAGGGGHGGARRRGRIRAGHHLHRHQCR